MYTEALDDLSASERFEGSLDGSLVYQSNSVTLRVDPDGEPLESTMDLAKKFLARLDAYHGEALELLYEKYFKLYNDTRKPS